MLENGWVGRECGWKERRPRRRTNRADCHFGRSTKSADAGEIWPLCTHIWYHGACRARISQPAVHSGALKVMQLSDWRGVACVGVVCVSVARVRRRRLPFAVVADAHAPLGGQWRLDARRAHRPLGFGHLRRAEGLDLREPPSHAQMLDECILVRKFISYLAEKSISYIAETFIGHMGKQSACAYDDRRPSRERVSSSRW